MRIYQALAVFAAVAYAQDESTTEEAEAPAEETVEEATPILDIYDCKYWCPTPKPDLSSAREDFFSDQEKWDCRDLYLADG